MKLSDYVKAEEDGKIVERRFMPSAQWKARGKDEGWYLGCEYRIKPEKPRVFYHLSYSGGCDAIELTAEVRERVKDLL